MGLQLFKETSSVDFMAMRRFAYAISGIAIILSLIAIIMHGGLSYGVDFTGGVAAQIQFEKATQDEALKKALASLPVSGLAIQEYGETGQDFLLRFSNSEIDNEDLRPKLLEELAKAFPDNEASIMRMEMVGPKVGSDLRNAALQALYFSVLLITVYISGRFEHRWMAAAIMTAALGSGMYLMGLMGLDMVVRVLGALALTVLVCWKLRLNFALGAIISLLHDVFITVGILTLMKVEFDFTLIAALLTLIGYSLNDTIIVYDRVRENLLAEELGCERSFSSILNASINQTLNRTVMTSITTLLAAFALLLLGGGVIHNFALTMVIGIVVGTFSSSFVATPILLFFGDTDHYLRLLHKPTEELEELGENGVV